MAIMLQEPYPQDSGSQFQEQEINKILFKSINQSIKKQLVLVKILQKIRQLMLKLVRK